MTATGRSCSVVMTGRMLLWWADPNGSLRLRFSGAARGCAGKWVSARSGGLRSCGRRDWPRRASLGLRLFQRKPARLGEPLAGQDFTDPPLVHAEVRGDVVLKVPLKATQPDF